MINPSILAADFTQLGAEVRAAAEAGIDVIHIDVMDGRFVPNISIGIPVVASLRPLADALGLYLDVHLMTVEPERYLAQFAQAGADCLTVHVEASPHLHRTIQAIKELGCQAGVALNPATPVSALEEVLPMLDLALIMTVNPGFGGQQFISSMTRKITRLRHKIEAMHSSAVIEIDGGVKAHNVAEAVQAGAQWLVSGSGVFNQTDPVAANVAALQAEINLGRSKLV